MQVSRLLRFKHREKRLRNRVTYGTLKYYPIKWDNIKWSNTSVIGASEGQRQEKEAEEIYLKIKIFPVFFS